jgi:Tfp pilus assembly protein PilF
MMKTSTKALTLAAILGLCTLAGCGASSHGKYTEEQRNAAKIKLDSIKSGIEYQTALGDLLAGDFPKALRSVENSLAMNEKSAKSWTLRGRIMLETGNLEGALQSFAKAEELDPTLVDTQ